MINSNLVQIFLILWVAANQKLVCRSGAQWSIDKAEGVVLHLDKDKNGVRAFDEILALYRHHLKKMI